MNNDLEYSLGIDTSGFREGTRDVLDRTKEIKKGFNSIKDVIGAGGVATAVVGFLRESVNYAMQLKGAIDENTAAAQRWGKAAQQTREESLGVGAQVVGFVTRGSESVGVFARGLFEAGKALVSTTGSIEDRARAAFDALELARQAHLKDVALSKEELENGEKRRVQLKEQDKLRESLNRESSRLIEREREAQLAQLNAQERVNVIAAEYLAKQEEIAHSSGNELEKLRLQNEYRDLGIQLLKAQKDAQEDVRTSAEKAADAEKKKKAAAEETTKELEKQLELQQEAAATVDRANAATRDAGFAGLTQAEADSLSAWVKGGKKGPAPNITRQGKLGSDTLTLNAFQNIGLGPVRNVEDFAQASNEVIQEMIRRYNDLLGTIRNAPTLGSPDTAAGDFARNLAINQVDRNRQLAQAELERRMNWRSIPFSQALREYQGDPLYFDRLYAQAARGITDSEKTVKALDDLRIKQERGLQSIAAHLQSIANRPSA